MIPEEEQRTALDFKYPNPSATLMQNPNEKKKKGKKGKKKKKR